MAARDIISLDQSGLEALYVELETPLYNVVYRWLWNSDDAHEVVQEAFVRLWRMRTRVDAATVRPLVYKIAINLASNRRRTRKLWRWVSLEAARGNPGAGPAADDALAADQTRRAVRDAIDALPEKYRRVITMCELTELTYEQIAAALNIAVGTVGSRRNTAMKLLRQRLGELEEEDRDDRRTRSV